MYVMVVGVAPKVSYEVETIVRGRSKNKVREPDIPPFHGRKFSGGAHITQRRSRFHCNVLLFSIQNIFQMRIFEQLIIVKKFFITS